MRRDMDLVRAILRELSESDGPLDASALADGAHDLGEVAYHLEIMEQAGLIRCTVRRAWGGEVVRASADALTWEGNDFLDAVASDNVWAKVKRAVGKTLGSASFETIKELAVKVGTEYLLASL